MIASEGLNSDRKRAIGLLLPLVLVPVGVTLSGRVNTLLASTFVLLAPMVAILALLLWFFVGRYGLRTLRLGEGSFTSPRNPAGVGGFLRSTQVPYSAVIAIGILPSSRGDYACMDLSSPYVTCEFWTRSDERKALVAEIARRSGRVLSSSWQTFLESPLEAKSSHPNDGTLDPNPSAVLRDSKNPLYFALRRKGLQKWLFLQERAPEGAEPGLVVGSEQIEASLEDGRRITVDRRVVRRSIANGDWTSIECYDRNRSGAEHFALMLKCYSDDDRAKLLAALVSFGDLVEPRDHVFLSDDLGIKRFYALGS